MLCIRHLLPICSDSGDGDGTRARRGARCVQCSCRRPPRRAFIALSGRSRSGFDARRRVFTTPIYSSTFALTPNFRFTAWEMGSQNWRWELVFAIFAPTSIHDPRAKIGRRCQKYHTTIPCLRTHSSHIYHSRLIAARTRLRAAYVMAARVETEHAWSVAGRVGAPPVGHRGKHGACRRQPLGL